ncbi:hypothetical protein ACFL09_06825, partial [Planctomycetota bacterium]
MSSCSSRQLLAVLLLALVAAWAAAPTEAAAPAATFTPSPATVTVEEGGSQFEVDIMVSGGVELWAFSFWAINPTDGPGTVKPTITSITKGSWWDDEFASNDLTTKWTVIGNPPPASGETGTPKTGTGAVAHVTVSYAGVDPGTYTMTFPNDQQQLSLVSYDLSPANEPLDHDPVNVTSLQITVLGAQPPDPSPMEWE